MLVTFIVPALIGIVVGVLSGLLGIGGGTVLVPVFRLALGLSPLMATATSLFTIIPTSLSGAASHIHGKTCVVSLGIATGLGGACTSPVGVWLATISPPWMIMAAVSLILAYSSLSMLQKAIKTKPEAEKKMIAGSPSELEASIGISAKQVDDAPTKMTRRQLLIGAAIGLAAGLASGYVGVGGGFIMVPLMLTIIGIPMKKASGTSLIAVMILAIPAVIEQGLLGHIDYMAGIAVAIGSIPGAVIGARLVTIVPERILRFTFSGFLLVAAAILVLNELGILG